MPAATTAKPHELIPAMLRDWGDIGAQVLVDRLQIAPDQAAEVAAEIALTISDEYAGRNLYLPTCAAYKANERDREIWEAYNAAAGRNVDVLVSRYSLSYVHILRICSRMRAIDRAERRARQGDMFVAVSAPVG